MPAGRSEPFARRSPSSIPPARLVWLVASSCSTAFRTAALRAGVICTGAATVDTSVVKVTTPQKSPGARWSTSFWTDFFAFSSLSPFIEPETSMTGMTHTGGRVFSHSTWGASRVTARWVRKGRSKRIFSKGRRAVVFMASPCMGVTDAVRDGWEGRRRKSARDSPS